MRQAFEHLLYVRILGGGMEHLLKRGNKKSISFVVEGKAASPAVSTKEEEVESEVG